MSPFSDSSNVLSAPDYPLLLPRDHTHIQSHRPLPPPDAQSKPGICILAAGLWRHHPCTPSPTRDSPFDFGEESSRAELSLEPRSPPSTAPLEREVEQLKAEVAHWQGHCLEAK